MITQPLPRNEAQPRSDNRQTVFTQPVLAGRRLYAIPQKSSAVGSQALNMTQALLQLIVGYEWLLSGTDKLLLGTFPAQLSGLLNASLSGGRFPSFFAALLRWLVLPNAVLFGYLIEWGETLVGMGLMIA